MITASEGDAWMGLKCSRGEKAVIGISWCGCWGEDEIGWERRGMEPRTAESNRPNVSPFNDGTNRHIFITTPLACRIEDGTG